MIELAQDDGIAIAGGDGHGAPQISEDAIIFNGREPDDYETCLIARGGPWKFCKTRGDKPYDVVVVAILCLGESLGILKATSDGTASEWAHGLALARRVFTDTRLPIEVS